MRYGTIFTGTLVLALLFSVIFASASEQEKVKVFITFKDKVNDDIVRNNGGTILHKYNIVDNVISAEVPKAALNGIMNNPNVESVEMDAEVSISMPSQAKKVKPDDPEPIQPAQTTPWGIDRIDAEPSINSMTGSGIRVCIIDTGIDTDHPDLAANIEDTYNAINPRKTGEDDNGHGTHVAGTIAAINNEIGVVGVAPEAKIIAVKALNSGGRGDISDIIAGIDECVNRGANVISMSLGGPSGVDALETACNNAFNSGVIVVAAAGNENSAVSYPAAYESVIAVAATDSADIRASFSNFGPEVELAAPGVDVESTFMGGIYKTYSGTSMATPHVAGVAALAIERNPTMTTVQIRALLDNTADDLGSEGRDIYFGYGLVDAMLE